MCQQKDNDEQGGDALLLCECNDSRRVLYSANIPCGLLIQLIDKAICQGVGVFVPIDKYCQSIEAGAEGFPRGLLTYVGANSRIATLQNPRR